MGEVLTIHANWHSLRFGAGLIPEGKTFGIRIQNLEAEKKGVVTYSVVVEIEGGRSLEAKLHVVIDSKDAKRIVKLRKKLTEENVPFFGQDDAVIVYKEADRAQLINVKQLESMRPW